MRRFQIEERQFVDGHVEVSINDSEGREIARVDVTAVRDEDLAAGVSYDVAFGKRVDEGMLEVHTERVYA